MPAGPSSEPRILITAGARATEALLLELVAPRVEALRHDWRRLAEPLHIVVPSRSLRDHVIAALLRRFAGALAAVRVLTLQGLAQDILARCGQPARPGDLLLPILVREEAAREPVLSRELGALEDGFGAALGSVRDLLDAGLEAAHVEAAEEALAGSSAPPDQVARAGALVRVAGRSLAATAALGLELRAMLLRRAADAVVRDPALALGLGELLVHGFADATGVATELLQALLRSGRARVLLDEPPDPADPARPDLGRVFSERFRGQLEVVTSTERRRSPPLPAPRVVFLEAPGAEAEARGVAERVRALLDDGAAPERIGIVARTLTTHAIALRTQLTRLAIPFSARRPLGGLDGAGRRVHALLDVLERREETAVDRWLETLMPEPGRSEAPASARAELRVALHALGAARLGHVAALDLDEILAGKDAYVLPMRLGLAVLEDEQGESIPRALQRRLERAPLAEVLQRARQTHARLAAWPETALPAQHAQQLRLLVRHDLAWHDGADAAALLARALEELDEELPAAHALGRAGFLLLLRERCRRQAAQPLGGAGAGVQLLDAIEARGCTFDHVFVVGLNRDAFPRVVLEDPLLPDSLRASLRVCLPDLPLKLGGFDEERYLFAQLFSASPSLTLSWQTVGDDGKERAPSALIERLRWSGTSVATRTVPALWARPRGATLRPPFEHAVLSALHGGRDVLGRVLPIAVASALAEGGEAATAADSEAIAQARVAVLDAFEPRDLRDVRLGPYFGFVGEAREAADPRRAPLAVTTLERLARCPWQTFVERLLRIAPIPDALEALPALDGLLLGTMVHATVDAIVRAAMPEERPSLERALERGPRQVPWPAEPALRRICEEQARAALRARGISSRGLVGALVARAGPALEAIRKHVWGDGDVCQMLGSELGATVAIATGRATPLELAFRADLALPGARAPVLIDLKTGQPISTRKTAEGQRNVFLASVAAGERLQAVAYALGGGGEGRYVFVDPARAPSGTVLSVDREETDFRSAFEAAVQRAAAAFDRGAFFPRLEEAEKSAEPACCGYCAVSEACLRGDSGARRRLRLWAQQPEREEPGPGAAALHAARELFARSAPASESEAEAGECDA